MSAQILVSPDQIEPGLLQLWEKLAKEKMRACLFNLIVFNELSPRTDYIRNIVQKVSEKYPCRVLFISSDPKASHPYLKTAISVVGDGNIACDYIDVGVSSASELEKIPFLLLPHIIPDLPISLLWTEDPSRKSPLFAPLSKLAHRLIFDSESADSLLAFSNTVLQLKKTGIDIADLNWARTEQWRDLIASLFHSGSALELLQDVRITYNARKTESFCHLKVQSMYLLAWLSSRLKWNFEKATKDLHFTFEKRRAEIHAMEWEKLGSGTVISIDLTTADGHLYQCARFPKQYHTASIQISSPDKCELPYNYVLGKTATGQSLVKEIITQGTSSHYLEMLGQLSLLDRDRLC